MLMIILDATTVNVAPRVGGQRLLIASGGLLLGDRVVAPTFVQTWPEDFSQRGRCAPGSHHESRGLLSHARRRRSLFVACVLAASAGALPSTAAASDETLRQEIQTVFVEVRPALEAFRAAAERVEDAPDTAELQEATDQLRYAMRRYKWGVVNRKASSPRGLAAKRQLLTAIRQFDIGLVAFHRALVRVDARAGRGAILSALRTANRRITEAARDESEALEALGVPATA